MTTLRRILVAVTVVLTTTVAATASTATAADFTVRPGSTTTISPGYFPITGTQVTPAGAGTLRLRPTAEACGAFVTCDVLEFTASTAFSGDATVTYTGVTPIGVAEQRTVTIRVDAARSEASGSFTPVLPPPPPGPCIVVTSNSTVRFGDVTVGGPFRNGDAAPTVSGCADPNIDQSVLVQASTASNGNATLSPGCAGVEPAACTPAAGSFAVALVNSTLSDDFVLRTVPTTWIVGDRGTFPATPAPLAVKLPATVDSPAVGPSFTFTVTFTAVRL